MSRRLILAALAALSLFAVLPFSLATAQTPDRSELTATSSLIGEQHILRIEVVTPPTARVEVDPAAPDWNGVAVVSVRALDNTPEGNAVRHRFELVVAPFQPGQQTFAPTVNVVDGVTVQSRTLPAVHWEVRSTLAPDAPLTLSPLPDPVAIDGAGSALIGPAIASGIVAGILLLGLAAWLIARRLRRREPELPPAEPFRIPSLDGAEQLLEHDPVAAYRLLASTVRYHVGNRYGLPAHALTARELQHRMESSGVDRWQARLVGGLLHECEIVVFARYIPARERRHGDLTVAREIVGVE